MTETPSAEPARPTRPWRQRKTHRGPVLSVAGLTLPDGRTLIITGSNDGALVAWPLDDTGDVLGADNIVEAPPPENFDTDSPEHVPDATESPTPPAPRLDNRAFTLADSEQGADDLGRKCWPHILTVCWPGSPRMTNVAVPSSTSTAGGDPGSSA